VGRFLQAASITAEKVARVRALQDIAKRRGQSLAQMALAWVLRDPRMTSALIGASRPEQVKEGVAALVNLAFTPEELAEIEMHAADPR
jgi:L-glyceraldehyde 3-phosphate reductase